MKNAPDVWIVLFAVALPILSTWATYEAVQFLKSLREETGRTKMVLNMRQKQALVGFAKNPRPDTRTEAEMLLASLYRKAGRPVKFSFGKVSGYVDSITPVMNFTLQALCENATYVVVSDLWGVVVYCDSRKTYEEPYAFRSARRTE